MTKNRILGILMLAAPTFALLIWAGIAVGWFNMFVGILFPAIVVFWFIGSIYLIHKG
jgi:hypothetical protein